MASSAQDLLGNAHLAAKELCPACWESHPLVPMNTDDPSSTDGNDKGLLKKATIHSYCNSCFQQLSILDFSTTFDIIKPPRETEKSGITCVYVHGGGGSRAMFRPHTRHLAESYGHGGILIDLPGHGSLVDVELTLDTCWQQMKTVLEENNLLPTSRSGNPTTTRSGSTKREKLVYVGGSLGAYIGFYLLQEFKGVFDGAVLIDCGQNCGPGRSLKASLGLHLLAFVGKHYSNKKLANMMLDVTRKSTADK